MAAFASASATLLAEIVPGANFLVGLVEALDEIVGVALGFGLLLTLVVIPALIGALERIPALDVGGKLELVERFGVCLAGALGTVLAFTPPPMARDALTMPASSGCLRFKANQRPSLRLHVATTFSPGTFNVPGACDNV